MILQVCCYKRMHVAICTARNTAKENQKRRRGGRSSEEGGSQRGWRLEPDGTGENWWCYTCTVRLYKEKLSPCAVENISNLGFILTKLLNLPRKIGGNTHKITSELCVPEGQSGAGDRKLETPAKTFHFCQLLLFFPDPDSSFQLWKALAVALEGSNRSAFW